MAPARPLPALGRRRALVARPLFDLAMFGAARAPSAGRSLRPSWASLALCWLASASCLRSPARPASWARATPHGCRYLPEGTREGSLGRRRAIPARRRGSGLRDGGLEGRRRWRRQPRLASPAASCRGLCIAPARPSWPSAACAAGGNARGFPRPQASHPCSPPWLRLTRRRPGGPPPLAQATSACLASGKLPGPWMARQR